MTISENVDSVHDMILEDQHIGLHCKFPVSHHPSRLGCETALSQTDSKTLKLYFQAFLD